MLGALGALLACGLLDVLPAFLGTTFSLLYPCFRTYKCIREQPEEAQMWLVYWVIVGLWTVGNGVVGCLARVYVPAVGYEMARVLALAWLYYPPCEGLRAVTLYLCPKAKAD